MGSEGRLEQTIATDQDNGLIFAGDDGGIAPDAVRERLLPFARHVNEALDRCGYPLCKGGVMAMNPRWCASLDEWKRTFAIWIDRGDPGSLLAASIFFDFRTIWGDETPAKELRADITRRALANPRFLKQMADNALRNRPPLSWFGELQAAEVSGVEGIDLKLSGSVPFVDAARIFALATACRPLAPSNACSGRARSWVSERTKFAAPAMHSSTCSSCACARSTGTLLPTRRGAITRISCHSRTSPSSIDES